MEAFLNYVRTYYKNHSFAELLHNFTAIQKIPFNDDDFFKFLDNGRSIYMELKHGVSIKTVPKKRKTKSIQKDQ